MPTASHSTKINFVDVVTLQTARGRLVFFALFPPLFLLLAKIWPDAWPPLSIYALFDIPSPSIGLTRAFMNLLRGDVQAAWQQNWLIFPALIITISIIIKDIRFVRRTSIASD